MPDKSKRDAQARRIEQIYTYQCEFIGALEQRGLVPRADLLYKIMDKIKKASGNERKVRAIQKQGLEICIARFPESEAMQKAVQTAARCAMKATQSVHFVLSMRLSSSASPVIGDTVTSSKTEDPSTPPLPGVPPTSPRYKDDDEYADDGDDDWERFTDSIGDTYWYSKSRQMKVEQEERPGQRRARFDAEDVSKLFDKSSTTTSSANKIADELRDIVSLRQLPSERFASIIQTLRRTAWLKGASPSRTFSSTAATIRTHVERFVTRFRRALEDKLIPFRVLDASVVNGASKALQSQRGTTFGEWHWLTALCDSSKSDAFAARCLFMQRVGLLQSREQATMTAETLSANAARKVSKRPSIHTAKTFEDTIRRIAHTLLWCDAAVRLERTQQICAGIENALKDENLFNEDTSGEGADIFYKQYGSLSVLIMKLINDARELTKSWNTCKKTFDDLTNRITSRLLERNVGTATAVACQSFSMVRSLELRAIFAMRRVQAFKVILSDFIASTRLSEIFNSSFSIVSTPRDGYYVMQGSIDEGRSDDFRLLSDRFIYPGYVDMGAQDSFRRPGSIDSIALKRYRASDNKLDTGKYSGSSSSLFHLIWPREKGSRAYASKIDHVLRKSLLEPVGVAVTSAQLRHSILACAISSEREQCGGASGPNDLSSVHLFWMRLASKLVCRRFPRKALLTADNWVVASSSPSRGKSKTSETTVKIVDATTFRRFISIVVSELLCARLAMIRDKLIDAERCSHAFYTRCALKRASVERDDDNDARVEGKTSLPLLCLTKRASRETSAESDAEDIGSLTAGAKKRYRSKLVHAEAIRDVNLLRYRHWNKKCDIARKILDKIQETIEEEMQAHSSDSAVTSRSDSRERSSEGDFRRARDKILGRVKEEFS